MSDSPQEKLIKDYIVKAYKRGVCTHDGGHIPECKRGMAGKGSHYGPKSHLSQQYRDNFDKIKWTKVKEKKRGITV